MDMINHMIIKIKYQKKGKPYFKDYKELNFNITHSGKYVACAISDTR